MKKEELLEAIQSLDEETLKKSEARLGKDTKKMMIFMAIFAVVISFGAFGVWRIFIYKEASPITAADEEYKNIYTVLQNTAIFFEQPSIEDETMKIQLDGYIPEVYRKLLLTEEEQGKLQELCGRNVEGQDSVYYISGHEDRYFVISKDESNDTYYLWKFLRMASEEYYFVDVLSQIYNLDSGSDIMSITVAPVYYDVSVEGLAAQNEIGYVSISDTESNQAIYDVIQNMKYVGYDINCQDTCMAIAGGAIEATRYCRQFAIMKDGDWPVDRFTYDSQSGLLYTYDGLVFEAELEEDRATLDRQFEITDSDAEWSIPEVVADEDGTGFLAVAGDFYPNYDFYFTITENGVYKFSRVDADETSQSDSTTEGTWIVGLSQRIYSGDPKSITEIVPFSFENENGLHLTAGTHVIVSYEPADQTDPKQNNAQSEKYKYQLELVEAD